ncbi:MAG: hypothetical protein KKF00_02895 [Proteobacteria bacterium]|nr:hypothetical protein [Pseudomonadota bacterium]
MTISRFYLCAIPGPFWRSPSTISRLNLSTFASDALSCERRVSKEVNLQDEHTRYTLICRQLEQEIVHSGRIQWIKDWKEFPDIIRSGNFPATVCYDGYLSILSRLADHPINDDRLGASFFPPDQVEKHRQAFQLWAQQQGLSEAPVIKQRLVFLENAGRTDCGVVELQTSFLSSQYDEAVLAQYRGSAPKAEDAHQFINIPEFEISELDRELFGEKGKKQHLLRILVGQIQEALRNNEPVSFGNQAPHDVITEALNHFVFVTGDRPLTTAQLRIAYSDGSEAEPFPVLCLYRSSNADTTLVSRPLKVSLMSMRHFELDPEIDFCWFRNREVSRTRTLAETDEFCYNTTTSQLEESLKQGDLYMHMFHTGFEPAIIGFYRGVVQKLLLLRSQKTPSLHVLPLYFRGGNSYQQGKSWD